MAVAYGLAAEELSVSSVRHHASSLRLSWWLGHRVAFSPLMREVHGLLSNSVLI
jgi:hypothetical protein